jgi:hypothetical protein
MDPVVPLAPIHRSAWKGNSPKLDSRFTEISEVRSPLDLVTFAVTFGGLVL